MGSDKTELVTVLDFDGNTIEYVHPSIARYALKHSQATLQQEEPCIIRLATGLSRAPRPPSHVPEVIRVEREKMSRDYFNPAQPMIDYAEFFDKVDRANKGDGIVWARCTAPQGRVVIIQVNGPDRKPVTRIPAITPKHPVCLSAYVGDLNMLRTCQDLNLAVQAGTVKLMTNTEAMEFFAKKAERHGQTLADVMREASNEAKRSVSGWGKQNSDVDQNQSLLREPVGESGGSPEDLIHPRLMDLCNQIAPWLKEGFYISAKQFQDGLDELGELTIHDLMYIESRAGRYPTIKKWASKEQQKFLAQPEASEQV